MSLKVKLMSQRCFLCSESHKCTVTAAFFEQYRKIYPTGNSSGDCGLNFFFFLIMEKASGLEYAVAHTSAYQGSD